MIKVFEAFSGYGSQSLALRNISAEYEVVGISEIDKHAIKAYYTLHDHEIPNFGDISLIDPIDLPDMDLFTYSFPCTDISCSGRQEGFKLGSGTRSSLLWECIKIIDYKRPKYLLMENVDNIMSKKFINDFHAFLNLLKGFGYKNYYKVLTPYNYGIPQSRKRVFVVSKLDDDYYYFPRPLEDLPPISTFLETNIDSKYYLTENGISYVNRHASKNIKNPLVVPALNTMLMKGLEKNFVPNWCRIIGEYRRPTERECFRFMGLNDSDIDKIQAGGIPATQQYKMAGNSIVVNVLEHVFRNLL